MSGERGLTTDRLDRIAAVLKLELRETRRCWTDPGAQEGDWAFPVAKTISGPTVPAPGGSPGCSAGSGGVPLRSADRPRRGQRIPAPARGSPGTRPPRAPTGRRGDSL